MKLKSAFLFFVLLLIFQCVVLAQQSGKVSELLFKGIVYGYEHSESKGLLGQNKQTVLEGVLEGVDIRVYMEEELLLETISNEKGEFNFRLKKAGLYRLEIAKEGYNDNILWINTEGLIQSKRGKKFIFSNAEFVLNSYKSGVEDIEESIGTLYYNKEEGCMDFRANEERGKKSWFLGKKNKTDNPVELLKRAVNKNKKSNSIRTPVTYTSKKSGTSHPEDTATADEPEPEQFLHEFDFETGNGVEFLLRGNLEDRAMEISKAREQLALDKDRVVTKEGMLLINQREALLDMAEQELETARMVISLQRSTISLQKKALYITGIGISILLGLLTLIIIQYRQKIKMNNLLASKNRKIMDSIHYARRIQQSILLGEKEIRKFLPRSFIYYRPKDVVSGDFYWFSQIGDKLVIAVVDCTGHGVPGAFMSLIGNTLLNQIVNEKQITEPAAILKELHTGVISALRQKDSESFSEDGMEMSLCLMDKKNSTVEYAGAMNPLYIVSGKKLDVIQGDIISIGGKRLRPGKEHAVEFTTQKIELAANSAVYMFTDGYMDQFGGAENKKFNTTNFKQLLLDIQSLSMPEQKEAIDKAFKDWKMDYPQIDDMLIAGFKLA